MIGCGVCRGANGRKQIANTEVLNDLKRFDPFIFSGLW